MKGFVAGFVVMVIVTAIGLALSASLSWGVAAVWAMGVLAILAGGLVWQWLAETKLASQPLED